MKRKYLPINEFPQYNDAIDRLMVDSKILNGGKNMDRVDILNNLAEITGDKNGFYMRGRTTHVALLPFVQTRIEEIEERFEIYKQLRVNQGYERPTVMPREMLDEFYRFKAQETILLEELATLNKWLETYIAEDKTEDDTMVLRWGLQEVSKDHGTRASNESLINVMAIIDNQRVTLTAEGLLIINDKRSPYSGMLVSDYRKLAKKWRKEMSEKEAETFKHLQDSYREQNLPVPQSPSVRAPRTVARASLPKWPSWAVNHLKNETITK